MAYFDLYTATGALQVDLSRRLPRFLGTATTDVNLATGLITHAAFSTGSPIFLVRDQWYGNFPDYIPKLTIDSGAIRWTYSGTSTPSTRFAVTLDIGVM